MKACGILFTEIQLTGVSWALLYAKLNVCYKGQKHEKPLPALDPSLEGLKLYDVSTFNQCV